MSRIPPISAVLALLLLGLLSGCALLYPIPGKGTPRAPIYAIYQAYPQDSAIDELQPIPYNPSWSGERQQKDLHRMKEANLDGLLLMLTPQDLASQERLERLLGFAGLCLQNNLKIILGITSPTPLSLDYANLTQFILGKKFIDKEPFYRINYKPLLVFSENIRLTGSPDSTFQYRQLGKEWTMTPDNAALSGDDVCWITAGCYQKGHWTLPRKQGLTLRRQLCQANRLSPRLILISSWNDYTDGSAVEYNTLDADAITNLLHCWKW